jgi:hypothetical protein
MPNLMKTCLFLILACASYSLNAQDLTESPEIERTRKQDLPLLIGEIGGNLIVQMIAVYQEESDLYKLDENLKIVSQGSFEVLYKPNRGAAAPTAAKELICFNDKIIAYYAIRDGKTANIYYDVINPDDFSVTSSQNLLYSHTYPGAANVRDWIDISPFQANGYLYMHISIAGLVSAVEAGNYKGVLLKLNNDMKPVFETSYEENNLGYVENIELMENGVFAFTSSKAKLRSTLKTEEFFINLIDDEGELTSYEINTAGKYLPYDQYTLLATTKSDYAFCGLYSDTGWSDDNNQDINGFFIKTKSQPISFVSFATLSETYKFSTSGYTKRSDGKASLQVHYDEASSTLLFVIFNTGQVDHARLGLIAYNAITGDIKAHETDVPAGTYSFIQITSDEDAFEIGFRESSKKVVSKVSLNVSKSDLTDTKWSAPVPVNDENEIVVEYWCMMPCDATYLIRISDEKFSILKED